MRAICRAATFPDSLTSRSDLAAALHGALDVLVAVPSHAFRAVLTEIAPRLEPAHARGVGDEGIRARQRQAAAPGRARGAGPERRLRCCPGPTFAREVGAGLPTAMTVASPERAFATALAQGLSSEQLPRLYVDRHRRRRSRRRGEERAGRRRRAFGRPGLRREHAHRADHARSRGDDAARRRARRAARNVHGARRARRSRAHVHGRPVAQPPFRIVARRREDTGPGARGNRAGGRGLLAAKAVHAVAQREKASTCRICEGIYSVLYEELPAKDVVRGLMTRPIKAENRLALRSRSGATPRTPPARRCSRD